RSPRRRGRRAGPPSRPASRARSPRAATEVSESAEWLPGDGWWPAPGEDPAGQGGAGGDADNGEGEVENWHLAQHTDVAAVPGGQRQVGGARSEQRTQQCQGAGGGGGEG